MEILQLGAISKLTRDSPQDRDYLSDCLCGLCWHTKKPSYADSQKCNVAGRWRLEKRGPGSRCWNRATQVWGIPGYIFLASPCASAGEGFAAGSGSQQPAQANFSGTSGAQNGTGCPVPGPGFPCSLSVLQLCPCTAPALQTPSVRRAARAARGLTWGLVINLANASPTKRRP